MCELPRHDPAHALKIWCQIGVKDRRFGRFSRLVNTYPSITYVFSLSMAWKRSPVRSRSGPPKSSANDGLLVLLCDVSASRLLLHLCRNWRRWWWNGHRFRWAPLLEAHLAGLRGQANLALKCVRVKADLDAATFSLLLAFSLQPLDVRPARRGCREG
jgi:hypothetical protein